MFIPADRSDGDMVLKDKIHADRSDGFMVMKIKYLPIGEKGM